MSKRRIAVVTTGRADYGQLYWLLRGVSEDPALELQLLVCGSHLDPKLGRTARLIEKDGFKAAASVPMVPSRDDGNGVAEAVGRGVLGFAKAFARLKPDILVVLGDRYELLAAASAAVATRLPIAHIHGGESTEGVLDEQVRHAVTKLSHLHFPAAGPYRRRLLQMGEASGRVYNFGAPCLEYLHRLEPLSRETLERRLNFSLKPPFFLVTYHPAALSGTARPSCRPLLSALESAGARAVITFANADAGGRAINAEIARFAKRHPGTVLAAPSLGQDAYLSLMRLCAAVVGNSSSGIAEAPSARVPTVNVGDRQKGRLRAPSVIDCPPSAPAIARALRRAMSPDFRRTRCTGVNPYGSGPVSSRILRVLKTVPLGDGLLFKKFNDRP